MANMMKIEFNTFDSVKLNAELYSPSGKNKKKPAVLIIEGSGKSGFETEPEGSPFKQLANALSKNDFYVIRYNKRGSGENAKRGSFWGATFTSDNKDASAAYDYLSNLSDVDKNNISIIGHSFGGPQSLKLAETKNIHKIIMLTSTVQPTDKLMIEQNETIMRLQKVAENEVLMTLKELKIQLDSVKNKSFKCVEPSCSLIDGVEVLDKSIQVPWLQEVLNQNFLDLADSQTSPVFFIFGNSDFVIPKSEQNLVTERLVAKNPKKFKISVIEKLDHFMVENETKEDSLKYAMKAQKEKAFKNVSSELIVKITDWLK